MQEQSTLGLSAMVNAMPGVAAALLNRRVKHWTDMGVLHPQDAKTVPGGRGLNRRYPPSEVYFMALANRLTEKGLNPEWLPHVIEGVRNRLTKTDFAKGWEAAKRGEQRYLLAATHPDPSNAEGMLLLVDIVEQLPNTKYRDAMFFDLTETFEGVRK